MLRAKQLLEEKRCMPGFAADERVWCFIALWCVTGCPWLSCNVSKLRRLASNNFRRSVSQTRRCRKRSSTTPWTTLSTFQTWAWRPASKRGDACICCSKIPSCCCEQTYSRPSFFIYFFIYLFKRLVQTRGPHHRGSQTNTKVQKHLHATNRRVCVGSYTQFILKKRMNTKASTGSITFGYRYTWMWDWSRM